MSAVCPNCGKAVPSSELQGLCPECLLKLGAAAQTGPAAGTNDRGGPGLHPPPPAPGEIAGHFPQLQILRCLGRGGMGVVYEARQPLLNRRVALKILAPEREKDPSFAERFMREAQALARLDHPNIVTVYDFGETGGLYYLLMEFVDGLNLRELLRTRKVLPEEALAIVPPICEALQYAHDQGVVHRDIKPENVLLNKQGRVKIADFGIAKLLDQTADATALTAAREVVGTPYYMAPEQLNKPDKVDHRADIYSLGVVFYEMLTGELPVGRFAPPSRKVQVDVRLDEVVLRALEKEPEQRYQHASQVKTAVETIQLEAQSPKSNVQARVAVQARKSKLQGPVMRGVLAVLLVALIAGAAGLFALRRGASRKEVVSATANGPVPKAWFLTGSNPYDYHTALDPEVTYSGKPSATLRSLPPNPAGFGTLMQMFKAEAFRGKRIRFSAYVRTEAVAKQAALWMRVDAALLPGSQFPEPLAFDNMDDRPISGTTDWTRYDVVLDVPQRAEEIGYGAMLAGAGQIWIADLNVQSVGTEVPTTGTANIGGISRTATRQALPAPKLDFGQ